MFEAKKFNIPELVGISLKNIEEHIKLYEGYVKHANLILEKNKEYKIDESMFYALGEINRRFGFEFNGIRNHEIFFSLLEGGSSEPDINSDLYNAINTHWGSFESWLSEFKSIAMTRGIGWAILYKDNSNGNLLNAWIDEQHLGQLQNCTPILAIDMWEHSYVGDYWSSGKKQYIEDFFKNINWKVAENRFV